MWVHRCTCVWRYDHAYASIAHPTQGVTGAAAGTLTFMIGGSQAGVDAATPLLDIMGANLKHCGDVGAGQVNSPIDG